MNDLEPQDGMRRGRGGVLVDAEGFTAKERAYVAEIQIDWNGTQAAIRAGYSARSAGDIAHELNRKPKIVDAIVAAMAERAERAKVDANWVLVRLVATERAIAQRGKKANPLHRLRALELIGKHVDVRAFRSSFGLGSFAGGGAADAGEDDERWDFSRLDDEEFEELGRLLRKCARGGAGGADPAAPECMGEGEGPSPAEA